MISSQNELDELERWLNDHYRPCSDTWPRIKQLIDAVREAKGWPDPDIRVLTLDEFTRRQEARDPWKGAR